MGNNTYIGMANIESNTGIYKKSDEDKGSGDCSKFLKGDVLFGRLRPYLNKVYFAEFNGCSSTEFLVLDSFDKSILNNKYLSIFLLSDLVVRQTKFMMSGNTLPRLQKEDFLNLLIPLPPHQIQNQIIQIIENAYKLKKENEIESKRLLNSIDSYLLQKLGVELPEEKKETVFQVDFSDVVGGRLDPFYYKTYFQQLEENLESGRYRIEKLGSLCLINRGGSPRPIHKFLTESKDGINWIKIGDTKNIDKYIYSTKERIKPEGIKDSRLVKSGDFILSNSMSFGKPYIMRTTGCIHDGWLLIRIKDSTLITEDYLHNILGNKLIYKFFKRETIGGVVENLNIDLVKPLRIPLPPLEIQNEIADHIQSIRGRAKELQLEADEVLKTAKIEVEKIILGEESSGKNRSIF